MGLKDISSGKYEYTDGDGSKLFIERAVPTTRKGQVAIRAEGANRWTWIAAEDMAEVLGAIENASRPRCEHCHGKGYL